MAREHGKPYTLQQFAVDHFRPPPKRTLSRTLSRGGIRKKNTELWAFGRVSHCLSLSLSVFLPRFCLSLLPPRLANSGPWEVVERLLHPVHSHTSGYLGEGIKNIGGLSPPAPHARHQIGVVSCDTSTVQGQSLGVGRIGLWIPVWG